MKKSLLSALMVCSLTLAAIPSTAFADNIDQQINQQDQKINDLKEQQSDVQAQISPLEEEIATVTAKVSALESQQQQLNEETSQLQETIATLKVRIAKREEAIQKQARNVQVNGQSTSYVGAVLDADSFSDVVGRVRAVSTIVSANNELVEQQKQDKQKVEEKVQENQEKIAELTATQQQLDQQKNAIANKKAELNVLKANLAAEQATAENDKAKLNKQKEAAEAEQARILKEQQAAEKARQEESARQAELAKKAEAAAQESTTKSEENTAKPSEASSNSTATPEAPANENGSSKQESAPVIDVADNSDNQSTPEPIPAPGIVTGGGIDHSNEANAYAPGQCTWYVKQVAPWAGPYWGNGEQWGRSAQADGYQVDGTPAAGSIVVFAGGQSVGSWTADPVYGHVAYVESYNAANNTITISQGGMGFATPMGPNLETLSASGLAYIHR
ncbi:CHAP domain-containing protein [Enterococcus florum]|uniref:CHAP domain-containing protein n=1 Tax=Enterococcus florum TaxID=2480627 RepID=A0A4V0WP05_9ENTE|nr:CHAP domain-containing protein [Enterococcus florum]GCF92179.1 CHAP domain-containing protein [Enterococcus florum]